MLILKMKKYFVYLFILTIFNTVFLFADVIPKSQLFIERGLAEENKLLNDPFSTTFQLLPITGWGETRFPASELREDKNNIVIEGSFSQGLILSKYSNQTFFQAFMQVDYTKDSVKHDWNNKTVLSSGIKLNHTFPNSFSIDMGAKYEWANHYETEQTYNGVMLFLNWFDSWSLDSSSRYPGFTWGGLRYPGAQDTGEEDNLIVEGAIEQGIDWYSYGSVTLNSFTRFSYTLDTKGHDWNNHITYGIGSKLKITIKDIAATEVGFRLSQNYMLNNQEKENRIISYLNWFF